jgi:hypothetical protein
MKYTAEQIEQLKTFAQKKVDEHNEMVTDNLQRAYGRASKEDYKMLEKETDEFIRANTLVDMLELIVEWGEDNEIPFGDLEDEFENLFDWEGHNFPEIYL